MTGSNAVIGFPDAAASDTNPGKYYLGGKSMPLIELTDQQTLLAGSTEQNATHTVLSFTKLLTEPEEVPINNVGANRFLVAVGSSNVWGYHQARHSFLETISCPKTCDPTPPEAVSFDSELLPISFAYQLDVDNATGKDVFVAEVTYEGNLRFATHCER